MQFIISSNIHGCGQLENQSMSPTKIDFWSTAYINNLQSSFVK